MIEAANSSKDKRFQNIANNYTEKEAKSINDNIDKNKSQQIKIIFIVCLKFKKNTNVII